EGLALEEGSLPHPAARHSTAQQAVVPPARARYLAEIADCVRGYHRWAQTQAKIARERQQLRAAKAMLEKLGSETTFDGEPVRHAGKSGSEMHFGNEGAPKYISDPDFQAIEK